MTLDRRFSYLKGECRRWLDPEEIDLESDLDRARPELDEGDHGHRLELTARSQPLARLGDLVSL